MQFAFTEDQLAFRDAVRDLLAKECPPEVVRAAWPGGPDDNGAESGAGARASAAQVEQVWAALADMGVLGIAVPESLGGLGLAEVDWVLLAEETGYAALPHPFVETACVAAPLLAAAGDADGLLGALLEGASLASAAIASAHAPWGDRAAVIIELDQPDRRWQARRITDVSPVPRDQLPVVDRSRHVVAVPGASGAAVGSPADARAAFERGALGIGAQLVGLGRRMLDLSVAYAIDRKQFGVPIGSQQAVKHHLADAALQLQFAAPAVYRAAWSLTTSDPNASRDVSMAKAMASDAARLAGRKALQVHGAIGYTVEYDLHLYLKRAEALARSWGDAAWHRRRVADALGI